MEERVLQISSDRDDRRIFWGLKFSISGFFGQENFGPAIFLGLFEAQGIFLGFDFYPYSIIPVTWNPEYPLWAWVEKDDEFFTLSIPSY